MKRIPDDTSPPEYSGPSILDIIPKDVLTSLILQDWGNFSIADLLRFCNTSKDARTKCDTIWTRFFRERCDVKIVEEAMEKLELPFPRFIANEMLFLLFKEDLARGKHIYIQDGSMAFVVRPMKIDIGNFYLFKEPKYLWIGFMGHIFKKNGTPSESLTKKREKDILKAMGKWYTPSHQSRAYMIPYTTNFELLEIFYNWVVFNLYSPILYHTQFERLYQCINCGNPATLQELGDNSRIFCSEACHNQ